MEQHSGPRLGRRSAIARGAAGAAALWATPVLTSVPAAAQQGSQPQQPRPLDLVDLIDGPLGPSDQTMLRPMSVAVDSSDRIFVSDSGRGRVVVLNADGTFSHQFGSPAPGPGQLSGPVGMALDGDGIVVILDNGDQGLHRWTSAGVFQTEVDLSGAGAEDVSFNPALLSAIGPVEGSRDVFIADYEADCVQVYTSAGAYVRTIGLGATPNDQFNAPSGVAVNGSGDLIISDGANDRVKFHQVTGAYLGEFDSTGSAAGTLDQPMGLAVDAAGRIYVTERGGHRVQIFDSTGAYLAHFGAPGTLPGQFDAPTGIAVDSTGRIIVADRFNDRIQIFQGLP